MLRITFRNNAFGGFTGTLFSPKFGPGVLSKNLIPATICKSYSQLLLIQVLFNF